MNYGSKASKPKFLMKKDSKKKKKMKMVGGKRTAAANTKPRMGGY